MASSSSHSLLFLIFFFFIFFSATNSQQPSTDPSYYYNLCGPSTCGNLTFSYPFSLSTFCRHPKLNSTCLDNHLVLKGQPQSDPHRVIGNIKIDGPNFAVPIASNALFSCGPVSKPNYITDSSIFSLSPDKYNYGTHLNCTRQPATSQTLAPVSCLGCKGDAVGNVCYYMLGFVNFPECENFFIFTPKGINVSAEKDLRGFLMKGFDVTYTMSEECQSCQGSGGRCGAGPDASFVCFCPSNAHRHNCSDEVIDLRTWKTVAGSSGGSKRLVIALSTSASAVIVIVLATLVSMFYFKRKSRRVKAERRTNSKDKPQTDLNDLVRGISSTRYSFSEIKKFTNNFTTKLGEGGFGSIYKGIIPGSGNDIYVAVKVLKISKQSEKQFMNEVATVGRIHHNNLVQLLGYCVQGKRRALVYEFMEKGSLDKYIYKTKKEGNQVEEDADFEQLTPEQLYNIALETARGLLYLHEGCRSRILHCDIKPHNVLLDLKFSAKVSDFGLARMINKDHSHASLTGTQGTPEYMAPEMWSKSYGAVTEKSDVYSYGMLLLEMAGGRKNYDLNVSASSQQYFPDWVYKEVVKSKLKSQTPPSNHIEIADVTDTSEVEVLDKMCLVGLWCIQHIPSNRPSMSRVIQMLEGNAEIQIPTNPFPEDGGERQTNFSTNQTVYFSAKDESVRIPHQTRFTESMFFLMNVSYHCKYSMNREIIAVNSLDNDLYMCVHSIKT